MFKRGTLFYSEDNKMTGKGMMLFVEGIRHLRSVKSLHFTPEL